MPLLVLGTLATPPEVYKICTDSDSHDELSLSHDPVYPPASCFAAAITAVPLGHVHAEMVPQPHECLWSTLPPPPLWAEDMCMQRGASLPRYGASFMGGLTKPREWQTCDIFLAESRQSYSRETEEWVTILRTSKLNRCLWSNNTLPYANRRTKPLLCHKVATNWPW